MKLSVFPRASEKKSDTKKLRRQGEVPGVLYGLEETNRNVCFKLDELQAILRQLAPGLLATTLFELQEDGKLHKAVVKEIQYHPASYAILHVDFALVSDKNPVTVNVPIQVTGLAECAGIKLGGFMRQVVRSLKVSCLPKDIPQALILDIRELDVGQSKTLADLSIPEGVRPLAVMKEVAVVIAKKAG
jgi:large subunit ribosomal protein L25